MQQSKAHAARLTNAVVGEMERYAKSYEPTRAGETLGTAWGCERINLEVEKMRALLVTPTMTEYLCDDEVICEADRLPKGIRKAFVVAKDDPYWLLFDCEAEDYVLVYVTDQGELLSIGIRGDATSTFLAR